MELLKGLGMCILIITIIKFIHFRYLGKNKHNPDEFSLSFWIKDNWMDYIINIGLSFIVFVYDHDAINAINLVLEKIGNKWRIIHFENKGFYFVLIPIVLAVLTYKFLRKKIVTPINKKVIKQGFTGGGGDLPPDQDEEINP